MPTTTFNNLNPAKQAKIRRALLNEFSHYSLADAQVARIVKDAGIARGAFYKYFADLSDAYRYLYQSAMSDIHRGIGGQRALSAADYVQQVRNFLESVNNCPYRELMQNHYRTNEGLLANAGSGSLQPHDAIEWAVMNLVHQTIKDCLLDPASKEQTLQYLQTVLQRLLGEAR